MPVDGLQQGRRNSGRRALRSQSRHAGDTQGTAGNLAKAAENQAKEIGAASTAINEMAVSIDQVSSNAAESAAVAEMLGMPAKTWYTILNEAAAFDASAQELAVTPLPADVPVGVLMHGHRIFPEGVIGDGLERDWLRANRALVRAQRQGHFAIAPQSGHLIHAEQPDLIVDIVRKVLDMGIGSN